MLSTMVSRPFYMEDPLRSWVEDRNIWREEYSHDWLDSFFSGWGRTSKLGSSPAGSPGINGFRSVAPPTCRPVFPACSTTSHGHNDVEETNTKREDYTKSWIQHLEEEKFPSLTNVNFKKATKPHTADVNNNNKSRQNNDKVRNVPIAMQPVKTVQNEANCKKTESGNPVKRKDDAKQETSADKAVKSTAKERWTRVGEGKEGLAPIWSVQSPTVKLTGTVVERSAKKEGYAHDWDDAEVIATQCGLSEVNEKAREELDREWRQDLLYCYPWETEGAFYRDVIHVELNPKTDKMGRPVLRRKHSFGS
ncbi:PREDICTED: uncharacterized protein LOC109483456 [Branchiostoma belcheri]|uniref:Uncharacterized protein LOC109483456 n=1 Tax=Branchiostoma belcheri TaxID=7741 RepID=A0A6P4ZYN2_BRABE|nr:PREDICTED: uncharacterized protein LOC109483456 [Branchiostoma belcheri]